MGKTHFLLQAKAVDLSILEVAEWTELRAAKFVAEARWGSWQEQVCPSCNTRATHWPRKKEANKKKGRLEWKCRHCRKCFSVTTGTPFQDHKRPLKDHVVALLLFVNSVQGQAAIELRRHLHLSYRTAYIWGAKVRESLVKVNNHGVLSGEIEMDGTHCSGEKRNPRYRYKRNPDDAMATIPARMLTPAARAAMERKSKSREQRPGHFLPNRRIMINMRQRSEEKGAGAVRTLVAVCDWEDRPTMEKLAVRNMDPDATLITDEAPGFRPFGRIFAKHDVVNHSVTYCNEQGVNQNQSESFFARSDRGTYGTYHRIAPKYMLDYACEFAWREDTRRTSNGDQLKALLRLVLRSGRTVDWLNFSHGHHRDHEKSFPQPRPFPPSGPPRGFRNGTPKKMATAD